MSTLGRMAVVSSLVALVVFAGVFAQDRERFARETGLDVDLVNVIQVDFGGAELTITFVYVNDRAFDSRISAALRTALLPYLDRNAIYVNPNVKSVVSQFGFDPLGISVQPSGGVSVSPEPGSWIEITPGFMEGRFEVNPVGPSKGSGSEGILILDDAIDPDEPFDLSYLGQRVTFEIASPIAVSLGAPSVGGPAAATTSHEPIAVPFLEDVTTLEEILTLPDFSSESMAVLLNIAIDDVRATEITTPNNDEILRLLFVRLEEGIHDSFLGFDFVSTLEPLIGTGAVMVWAFSPTGVAFSPWIFYFQQSETNFVLGSPASFVELTPGFVSGERIEANEMAAGVLRLPSRMDPGLPFDIFYRWSSVSFP